MRATRELAWFCQRQAFGSILFFSPALRNLLLFVRNFKFRKKKNRNLFLIRLQAISSSSIMSTAIKFMASDGTAFTDKRAYRKYEMETRYTLRNVVGEQRMKNIGDVEGQPFDIIGCKDSELLVFDYCDQVQIDDSSNCKVLIGASSESVFVRNCRDCTFTVACKQLRTRDCSRCTFYLYCKTEPIIETSLQMR